MSSVASSARASSTACANLYDTPVHDAVCAMPYSKDNTKLMSDCCKDANVVSYYNNCGLYCLAIGQSVEDLTNCLYGKGAEWEDVFCRGNVSATATATGTDTEIAASASASVVSVADDKKDSDKTNDDKKEDSKNSGGKLASQGYTTLFGMAAAGLVLSSVLFGGL